MSEKIENIEISDTEKKRREKVSKIFKKYHEKKRKEGYNKWLKKMRKEKKKRDKEKEKEKEKLRKKKEKEKLKRLKELTKKSVGRPKKPGPKKKRKKKIEKPPKNSATFNYKLISCCNGKQIEYIDKYNDLESAYNKIDELLSVSKKVKFPKRLTVSSGIKKEATYEYLLLEKNRNLNKSNPLMRNKYGKLIEQRVDSEKWVIVDKFEYNVEETFWVYGYNPNLERKTFDWVYENMILYLNNLSNDIGMRILLYKNKLIIKMDDGHKEIILCKNKSDAIRFYNLLEERINKEMLSNIFFMGAWDTIGDRRRKLEEELIEWTGWDKYKIQKSTTTKTLKK